MERGGGKPFLGFGCRFALLFFGPYYNIEKNAEIRLRIGGCVVFLAINSGVPMSNESQVLNRYARDFNPGEVIIEDGTRGTEMFIVQSGKVKVYKVINGVEKVLATMGAGEFFGEMALFNNKPRSASISAEEPTRVIVIDSKTLESMIKNNAEIAIRMLKKFAARLDSMDKQIEMLMIKDKNRKVVNFLIATGQESGSPAPGGGTRVNMTSQALAGAIGLSIEETNAVIEKVVKAGLLKQDATGFVIGDNTKLMKFLDYLAMKEEFGDFN